MKSVLTKTVKIIAKSAVIFDNEKRFMRQQFNVQVNGLLKQQKAKQDKIALKNWKQMKYKR